MTTQQQDSSGADASALPQRGSFPQGPRGETVGLRRERYEKWVLGTQAPRPDLEWQAVQFLRGKGKPSLALCIDARCQQCEHGRDDGNGSARMGACAVRTCGLWPVRPYQDKAGTLPGRRAAVYAYCGQCMGGAEWRRHYRAVAEEVRQCSTVHCAVWPVRGREKRDADDLAPDVEREGGA